jgi:hypothetical protein
MILVFTMWLLKKYLPVKNGESRRTKALNKKILIVICLLSTMHLAAQQQKCHYIIFYKGNDIGKMDLIQVKDGDELLIKITSSIKMRMLMSVKVNIAEEAFYSKERLMHSSVFREVNGKQKANRQTHYANNSYRLSTEGKTSMLDEDLINYNVSKMYLKEPVNITKVYSDNFQQFLNIKNIKVHTYRLELPDGNYNVYHYKEGVCSKIDVHSTFFTIQMQLIN